MSVKRYGPRRRRAISLEAQMRTPGVQARVGAAPARVEQGTGKGRLRDVPAKFPPPADHRPGPGVMRFRHADIKPWWYEAFSHRVLTWDPEKFATKPWIELQFFVLREVQGGRARERWPARPPTTYSALRMVRSICFPLDVEEFA